MANTIDVLGDIPTADSIINRTIESFEDNGVTSIRQNAFRYCTNLKSVVLPNVRYINDIVFLGCTNLELVDLGKVTSIGSEVFKSCPKNINMILRNNVVCDASSSSSIPPNGKIYVPSALLSSYKTATNWSKVADRIFAIEGSEFE